MTQAGAAARRARVAVSVVFFANGALFATWATRTPAISADLGLGPQGLAAAVFGLSAGAVLGLPLAGALVARWGSAPVVRAALAGYAAALAAVPSAPSLGALTAALLLLGMGNGVLDVAMNASGALVERRYPRQIMGGFHALFSFGGLAGALAGTAVAGAGVPVGAHLPAAALLLAAAGLVAAVALPPDPPRPRERARRRERDGGREPRPRRRLRLRLRARVPESRLLRLGALVFCSLLCEGAANDWSAVHIRETLGGSPAAAASGFAAFSLAMTVGRLLADRLAARLGAVAFLRGAAVVAGAGFAASLPAQGPAVGIAGFALLGAGLSGVVPTLFSLAARGPGHPAAALSTVSTIGYLGFLVGPALIGALSAVGGLRWALAALVAGTAVICAGARAAAD